MFNHHAIFASTISLAFTLTWFAGSSIADDWTPEDSTFDPNVQSVVIGNRSWLGDPSPFLHEGSKRTGYTYVNATQFEGMDPSVGVSLMVPLEIGETKPVGGGIVMMSIEQAKAFNQAAQKLIGDGNSKESKIAIKSMIDSMNWTMILIKKDAKPQALILENKTKDQVDRYQFSVNAMKKLVGAVEHGITKLTKKPE